MYKIQIDWKFYEIEQQFITGLELKQKANVPQTYGIWLVIPHPVPDKEISDNEQVDLNQPERNLFFTGSKNITEG